MSQAKSADTTLPAAAVPTGGGSSRRALLTAAPAAVAGALLAGTAVNAVAISLAKAGEVDPIFEVIQRHRDAIAREDAAHRHFEEMDAQYPMTPDNLEEDNPRSAAYDVWNDLCNVRYEITAELATMPTAVAGLAALLQHWADIVGDDEGNFDNYDTTKLLTALANGLRRRA
jgi:hypothetical protein